MMGIALFNRYGWYRVFSIAGQVRSSHLSPVRGGDRSGGGGTAGGGHFCHTRTRLIDTCFRLSRFSLCFIV